MTEPLAEPYYHVVRSTLGSLDLLPEWHAWYEDVHIPALLAVPGIRWVKRYAELDTRDSFLAIWEIDGPHVFDEPAYQVARGWGEWEPHMREWTISLVQRCAPDRYFSRADS